MRPAKLAWQYIKKSSLAQVTNEDKTERQVQYTAPKDCIPPPAGLHLFRRDQESILIVCVDKSQLAYRTVNILTVEVIRLFNHKFACRRWSLPVGSL